jgi:hypothetical protein
MSDIIALSYHYGYGGGRTEWIGHIAVSAVVNALIYGLIFWLMHELTAGQAVVLVVTVLVALFLWGRSRDRSGW